MEQTAQTAPTMASNGRASSAPPAGGPEVPVIRNHRYGFQYAGAFKAAQTMVAIETVLLDVIILAYAGLFSDDSSSYGMYSSGPESIIAIVSMVTICVVTATGVFLYWIIGVMGHWYENAAITAQSVTEMRNLLYAREYERGGLRGIHITAAPVGQTAQTGAAPAPSAPPVPMPASASPVSPVSVPAAPVASAASPVPPVAVPGTCAHCGKPLPPNGRFCTGCGAPVPAASVPVPPLS